MKQKPTRRRFLHGTVAAAGGAMPLNGKSAHAHRDDRLPEPERSGIEHIVVVMRVPTIVASPWTHSDAHPRIHSAVFDHTSILKLIETKWNLPAMTLRDANADDLFDCLDFHRPPAFLDPPALPAPGYAGRATHCTPGDPGPIPPASAGVASTNRGFASAPVAELLRRRGR